MDKADSLFVEGHYEQAAEHYATLASLGQADARARQALALLKTAQYDEALRAATAATQTAPTSATAWRALGCVRENRAEFVRVDVPHTRQDPTNKFAAAISSDLMQRCASTCRAPHGSASGPSKGRGAA